jgi:hypothetical protein
VARAYAISNAIIAYPVLLMGHRACGLKIKKTLIDVAPLLLCALLMGGAVELVGIALSASSMEVHGRLIIKVFAGMAVYGACLRMLSPRTYSEILADITAPLIKA